MFMDYLFVVTAFMRLSGVRPDESGHYERKVARTQVETYPCSALASCFL